MALIGPYATEAAAIAACSSGGPETWECQCGLVTEDGPPPSVTITVNGLSSPGATCPCAPVNESATMYLGTVPAGSFDEGWPFGCDGTQGYLFTDLILCGDTYTFLLYCASNGGVPGDMEMWVMYENGTTQQVTLSNESCEPFSMDIEFLSNTNICEGEVTSGPGIFTGTISV